MISKKLKIAGVTLSLATVVVACGCSIAGAIAAKTVGNPNIPAKYVLEKVPTLVWVENFQNPDVLEADAILLAHTIEDKLKKKDVVPIVGIEKAIDQKNLRPKEFRNTSIAGIGRLVGAEQIIYIDLVEGGLLPLAVGGTFQGKAAAQVKVIRAQDGVTLWPMDAQAGYPVTAETNPIKSIEMKTANEVRINLYDYLSGDIARLFYSYDEEELPKRQ